MNAINDSHIIGGEADMLWCLRSHIAGQSPRSLHAVADLTTLCEEHPALVRRLPAPVPKIIGDLSNPERVLVDVRLQPDAPR